MGQQLSSSIDINEPRSTMALPAWYTSDSEVNTTVAGMLQASVLAVTNGNNSIYQRIKKFYPDSTPLTFIKQQFQTRLAILHPDFLKYLLSSKETINNDADPSHPLIVTGVDKYFKYIVIDAPAYLSTLRNKNYIIDALTRIATEYHSMYKMNVFLFAEICSTIVDILSDCLGYDFANTYQSAWYTYFCSLITIMKGLPSIQEDNSLCFITLREYMISKNYPFIEFSQELLGCNHPVIDLQHQWLVTLLNVLNCVILDNNSMGIDMNDIFAALRDYSALHFFEEEQLFLQAPVYPEKNFHLQQHQDFLNNVIKISNDIQIVNSDEEYRKLLNNTLAWLVRWLTNHIRVVDRNMMKYCVVIMKSSEPKTEA